MEKTTSVRYWVLALLLCSTFLFSACKKDKNDPAPAEVYEEKDPKLVLIRDWVMRLENYNLTGIKPSVTFSNFDRDGVGPFKGENFFTLEMAKTLGQNPVRVVNQKDTKPFITLHLVSMPVAYKKGGEITTDIMAAAWFRNIHLNVRPATKDEDFAALVVINESMSNMNGDEYGLWRVEYTIPKK
jgi:hypothetical protein